MASSSLNSDGQKRMRVMSLDYFKNSLLRKTSQKTVCCCNNDIGLNIEVDRKTSVLDDKSNCSELNNETCKNCGKTKVKHKSGVFKYLRKWLWQNNLRKTTVEGCPGNKLLSECTNCTHSAMVSDKSKDNLTSKEYSDMACGIVKVSQDIDDTNMCSERNSDEALSDFYKDICSSSEINTLLKNEPLSLDSIICESEPSSLISGDASNLVIQEDNSASVCDSHNSDTLPLLRPKTRSLTCELLKLSKFGWYWGPISREEAEEKLLNQPDGAFLVRDSSADHYLLSLSFKSSGKILHARIEHSQGLFSFYNQPEQGGFATIVELIDHSVSFSQSAVFCYSRPRSPGHPAFPVRLTKAISRFTQVRSLQYLCRFVIRQYIRKDNIENLPLPNTIKVYIQEGHY